MAKRIAATLLTVVVASACGTRHAGQVPDPARPRGSGPRIAASPPPERPAAGPPAASPTAGQVRPGRFAAAIAPIGPAAARHMTSWHAGCPVSLDDLRVVTLRHWGFDERVRVGRIVVHRDVAADVVAVFRRLFAARFPVERMVPVEAFGSGDDRVMAANDTSGFNCREATGQPGVWSEHSYGRAIDVNPLQNPYVDGGTVLPPAGRKFLDRSVERPGMIHDGDEVVRAFGPAPGVGWALSRLRPSEIEARCSGPPRSSGNSGRRAGSDWPSESRIKSQNRKR